MGWFGPLEALHDPEKGFLLRIEELLAQEWFHGALETNKAEAKVRGDVRFAYVLDVCDHIFLLTYVWCVSVLQQLRTKPNGSFLVRFSNNRKNCFVISCVDKVSSASACSCRFSLLMQFFFSLQTSKQIAHTVFRHDPGRGLMFNNVYYESMLEVRCHSPGLCPVSCPVMILLLLLTRLCGGRW